MTTTTPKIRLYLVLPGGACHGAFSSGFLHRLFDKYEDRFELVGLDGTSVGALNGFAVCAGALDALKRTWTEDIRCDEDVFGPVPSDTTLSRALALYRLLNYRGLYDATKVRAWLDAYEISPERSRLDRFRCTVTNLRDARCDYVPGTHPKIKDFVVASASPWILTRPVRIDGTSYVDGGLIDLYPLRYALKASNVDKIVVVGYDRHHFDTNAETYDDRNGGIFALLLRLINIQQFRGENAYLAQHHPDLVRVENPMTQSVPWQFREETIRRGFRAGEIACEGFVRTHLLST